MEESEGEYNFNHDSNVHMHMADDVYPPYSVDFNCDVDMERDGDYEGEDDQKEDNEEEEDEEEEQEDEHQDDGKEPWTIGQGEMVNTSADNVHTVVDDQPIMQPEHGQHCTSILRGHNLRHLPHGQKSWSLAHDHQRQWLIPSGSWSIWVCWGGKNLAQQCKHCQKLRQPDTHRMWMWISSCWAQWQVATVSPMSCCPMSLSMKCRSMAQIATYAWFLVMQRMQWLLWPGWGHIPFLLVSFVLNYLSQMLMITHVARFLDRSGFNLFMGFVWFYSIHTIMGHHASSVFATSGV